VPIVLTGHGRSGTNWLLDLLNASPHTHCRNEPDEIRGSLFSRLPPPETVPTDESSMRGRWEEAINWAGARMGERDHPIRVRKAFIWPFWSRLGLPAFLFKRKSRHCLAILDPSLRNPEWQLPWWLGSREQLARAVTVLKLVMTPGWIVWLLREGPPTAVVHVVRHPGGFLNSWRNRYLARKDYGEVLAANLSRLERVRKSDVEWARRLPEPQGMSAEEAELWYWLYATEVIHAAGVGAPQYRLVIYEQLVVDTVGVTRKLYSACGLPWTDSVESRIRRFLMGNPQTADAWKKKLKQSEAKVVARILSLSSLRSFWEGS